MEHHRSHIYGVMAEFDAPEQLIHAVEKTREAGYHRMDAYTPFPVEGLAHAMGLKRNMVPFITLLGGAVVTWPVGTGAQLARTEQLALPTIGFLNDLSPGRWPR